MSGLSAASKKLLNMRQIMTLRASLMIALGALLLGSCSSLMPSGQVASGNKPVQAVDSSLPIADRLGIPRPLQAQEQEDIYWGVKVKDPYRFLEQRTDPKVIAWTKAQAVASEQILTKINGRKELEARLRSIMDSLGVSTSAPKRSSQGHLFYTRRLAQENRANIVWREGLDKPEHVLVDIDAISRSEKKALAIQGFWPSSNGRRLAYTIQEGGSEIGSLHVMDVMTKKPLIEPIDRVRFASLSWDADAEGFFYSRLRTDYKDVRASERFQDTAIHYLDLKQPDPERIVFRASAFEEEKLPLFSSGYLREIPQTDLLALTVIRGVDRRLSVYVAPRRDVLSNRAQWKRLVHLDDDIRSLSFGFGYVWALSARGAPTHKLIAMPMSTLMSTVEPKHAGNSANESVGDASQTTARWVTVLEASDAVIRAVDISKDALYITRRRGVNTELLRARVETQKDSSNVTDIHTVPRLSLEVIKTPREGNITTDASDDQTGVMLTLSTWTHPTQRFWYEPQKNSLQAVQLSAATKLKIPKHMVAREVMYRSHDGVMVPMSILLRSDLPLDGMRPTLLYGYGAYGITQEPSFSPSMLAWIERGGIYAIAHVRGGGNFGSAWHEAGKKTTKYNTWKDGIAAAEWLIEKGYTQASRLGIYGGSAGGMFVGRAITERPELFAAAVPSVAVLDLVRSEQRANGAAQIPEYGTISIEKEFHALLRNSSYHAIEDGKRYPAVMLMHGVNDSRVDVWQSTKFASRLSQAQDGRQVVLLRLDYQSGHGSGSSLSQTIMRSSDLFSFLLWQMKEPGFELGGGGQEN